MENVTLALQHRGCGALLNGGSVCGLRWRRKGSFEKKNPSLLSAFILIGGQVSAAHGKDLAPRYNKTTFKNSSNFGASGSGRRRELSDKVTIIQFRRQLPWLPPVSLGLFFIW